MRPREHVETRPEDCRHPHYRAVTRWHGKIGKHHMFQCQECGRYLRPVMLEVDPLGKLIQKIDQGVDDVPCEQSVQRQNPEPGAGTS